MAAQQQYEFVNGDEKVVAPGIVARRIRAIAAIPAPLWSPAVALGDLGGYIASTSNLKPGDALVYGDAQVSGNALVYGDAHVYGDGMIFWASKIGTANGTLTVYNTKDNTLEVTRGCFRGSVDEFLSKSEQQHDDQTHLEYRLLIKVAHSRITRAIKTTGVAK